MRSRRRPPALAIQLFGVPTADVDGRRAALALQRAFALLAYLGFNEAPVPRASLAALLWPDATEAQGRTRLRRLIYSVEHALGQPVFAGDRDALTLQAHGLTIDALAFASFARRTVAAPVLDETTLTRARAWIERARHPLMQGIMFGSASFDDWHQTLTIEHERLLSRLLHRTIDALAARRAWDTAQEMAEQLIALDPFSEPSYVALMELHAMQGHTAGVESSYMRCADTLRHEFGIRPGPSTEAA